MMNDWYFIVNPCAAGGKSQGIWEDYKSRLGLAGINFEFSRTERPCHAGSLTVQAIEKGYRNFVAVGGDGTLNEILNGLCSQETVPADQICLTQIPVGTGNDWRKTHDLPGDPEDMIQLLKSGIKGKQDIGCVTYRDDSGAEQIHYFLNIAGLGFDAVVAAATNKAKEKGRSGKLTYLLCLLKSLVGYKLIPMRLEVDGEKFFADVLSMSVAICQYNGGGMKQAPDAIPDDGLFDVTVISEFNTLEIVRHINKLYDGSFTKLPKVHTFRGKHVKIDADPYALLEADGESLGRTPFEFRILPVSLGILHKHTPLTVPLNPLSETVL